MARKQKPYIPYVTGRTRRPKRYTKPRRKPANPHKAAPLSEGVYYLARYGMRATSKTLTWGRRGHRVITAPIKLTRMLYRGLRGR